MENLTINNCNHFFGLMSDCPIFGKVLSITDGDTLICGIENPIKNELYTKYVKIHVRVVGVDTPELHSKSELEQKAAKIAKNVTSQFFHTYNNLCVITPRSCSSKSMKTCDSFGRIIADVDGPDGTSLKDFLINKKKCAKPYAGPLQKRKWTDEELNEIISLC